MVGSSDWEWRVPLSDLVEVTKELWRECVDVDLSEEEAEGDGGEETEFFWLSMEESLARLSRSCCFTTSESRL